MEHPVGEQLKRPELVGRGRELDSLKSALGMASEGKGSAVFIAGEAGVGKTRLVSELMACAEPAGFRTLAGWCLAESLEPLMPVREMLRSGNMQHLISGAPPPLVLSAYLINRAGLLIAEAQRQESGLDADIFAGMLQAVSNFVRDSLSGMSGSGGALNSLGYGDFTILIQSTKEISLAVVIKGEGSEFLVGDMKRTLADYGTSLDAWSGSMAAAESAKSGIAWYVRSGKYDGRFLVDDPRLRQENLFDNILMGLQRASAEAPLLVFIDDLQWADPTTLTLIHYIARNTRSSRILIAGTYRPEDLVAGDGGKPHHLVTTMQNMTREDLLTRIDLARLDMGAAAALVESALGRSELDSEFTARVHRETGGTPFFVIELLRLLIEERMIERDASGAWRAARPGEGMRIPSKIYDVVKRRLDRLPAEQLQLLECASVIGEEFQTAVLERVSGTGRLALLRSLGDIEKSHRLIRYAGERYRFDHAKIRDVLYSDIPDELRMEYHRLIGDALLEVGQASPDGAAVAELAYHFQRAGDPRAAGYLLRAADIARSSYANEVAVGLYADAMPLLSGPEKFAALESLADVQAIMGRYDASLVSLEAAGALASGPEARARLARKRAEVMQRTGDFDAVLAQVASARAEFAGMGGPEPGRLSTCEAAALIKKGQFGDALRSLAEAKAAFGQSAGSDAELSSVSRLIGNVHWNRGEYDSALEHYERSLSESGGTNPLGEAMVFNNIGAVHMVRGDTQKALDFYSRGLELRERIGEKAGMASSLNNIGIAHQNLGDLPRALETFARALAIREMIGDKRGVSVSLLSIGIIHYDRGDLDLAMDFYNKSLEISEMTGETSTIAILRIDIGYVLQDMGQPKRALASCEQGLRLFESIGERRGVANSLCGMAEAHLLLGNVQAALDCASRAVAMSVEIGAQKEEALSRRALGAALRRAGRLEEARSELDAAEWQLLAMKERKEAARVRYEKGLLAQSLGRPAEAGQSLNGALSEFEALGMRKRAEEARAALERI